MLKLHVDHQQNNSLGEIVKTEGKKLTLLDDDNEGVITIFPISMSENVVTDAMLIDEINNSCSELSENDLINSETSTIIKPAFIPSNISYAYELEVRQVASFLAVHSSRFTTDWVD